MQMNPCLICSHALNSGDRQRPVSRSLADAIFHIAESIHKELSHASTEIIQKPLREPDGAVSGDVADADILISGGAIVDDAVLSQLRNVRFLLRPYVGYDDIDVDAVTRHGILFANVPDAFIEEVPNHAMALILACNRRLVENDAFVRSGRWSAGARNREATVPLRRAWVLTVGAGRFWQHRPPGAGARPPVRVPLRRRRSIRLPRGGRSPGCQSGVAGRAAGAIRHRLAAGLPECPNPSLDRRPEDRLGEAWRVPDQHPRAGQSSTRRRWPRHCKPNVSLAQAPTCCEQRPVR